ncbi:MAG: hypothetical protein JJU45_12210 [Acidimicrobiia bacterium]|nr:hypothetical protein [Acidimicrobiia bacterium]
MSRPVRLVVAGVLAVAIALTVVATVRLAQRASGAVVASVGSYELTEGRLEEILEAVDGNMLHQQARERMGAPGSAQTADGEWDPGFVAEVVTSEINFELARVALDDLGGEISAPDRQGARRTLEAFMGEATELVSGGERADVLLSQYGDYGERLDDGLSAQRAVQRVAMARADRDAEVAGVFAEMEPPVEVLCASWVAIELDEEALDEEVVEEVVEEEEPDEDVVGEEALEEDPFAGVAVDPASRDALAGLRAAVVDGADLADEAPRRGLDPVSSACAIEDELDPEVAAVASMLAEGEISEITPMLGGFAVVLLDERRPAEIDEAASVVAYLLDEVVPGQLLDATLRRTADEVEVWVDSSIGRWDPEDLRVVPPAEVGEGFELLPEEESPVVEGPVVEGPVVGEPDAGRRDEGTEDQ